MSSVLQRDIWTKTLCGDVPGCPDKGEIFIKGNIVIQAKTNMERRGPMAAHTAFDIITQEIREVLKELDESLVADTEEFNIRRPGKKKVVIVKKSWDRALCMITSSCQ